MENLDWLDERLAVDRYIPDDGFTARVVSRLPERRSMAVIVRRRILFVSVFLAVCLGAVQVVPLVLTVERFLALHSPIEAFVRLAAFAEQPFVLVCAAAGIIALSFASIPLLRRWA
jgi:hypothetical protein